MRKALGFGVVFLFYFNEMESFILKFSIVNYPEVNTKLKMVVKSLSCLFPFWTFIRGRFMAMIFHQY